MTRTAKEQSSVPLVEAVKATVRLLELQHIPYFLLGGLAVSALGEARFTCDVDVDIL